MEALLSKPSLKENLYSKHDARQLKRKQNTQRCKKARGITVKDKRNIPEDLELSDDSVHVVTLQEKKRPVRNNKPSRSDLLKEWRQAKEKQKNRSKPSRAAFVVKHVVHNDNSNLFINKELTNEKDQSKVLLERNINNLKNQKNNGVKQRITTDKQANKVQPRSLRSNSGYTKENTLKKEVVDKARPVTRSSKNKFNVAISSKKDDKQIKTKNEKKIDKSCENKAGVISKTDTMSSVSDCTNNIPTNDSKILKISSNIVHEGHADELKPEPFVDRPTTFEVPLGLAFTNFKFDKTAFSPTKTVNKDNTTPIKEDLIDSRNSIQHASKSVSKRAGVSSISTPKTPVTLFKTKQRMTPSSTPKQIGARRASLTPNPKNFFSKVEDPVAQRIDSPAPKAVDNIPDGVSVSAKLFTEKVAIEEEKFMTCIEKWNQVLDENSAPEEVHGDILSAVGQAQLFIRKRFKQFKQLIELHKDKSAEKGALESDLDGFWEMIYFQVVDVHKRFAALQVLQQNNWQQEIVKKPIKKMKKPIAVKKPIPSKAVSKRNDFKQFRAQMKAKKLAEQQQEIQNDFNGLTISNKTPSTLKKEEYKISSARRSLSNFEKFPKNSPTDVASLTEWPVKLIPDIATADEFSADSLEDSSPDKHCIKAVLPQSPEDLLKRKPIVPEPVKSLRRSTRKTPSKYKSVDPAKPDDIACNLFQCNEDMEQDGGDVDMDFTKYLSKTIIEDEPIKRGLLPSLNGPFSPMPICTSSMINDNNDLMAFSPIPQSVSTQSGKSKSIPPSSLLQDLL